MLRLIITTILLSTINSFFIDLEDIETNRSAHIYGVVKLGHYHQDNKLAFMIEGVTIVEQVGQPPFTIADIDIIHEIEQNLYRFQPQNMRPIDLPDKGHPMVVLNYESKKKSNMKYRFHFSGQLEQQIAMIRQFIESHQVAQPPKDLFSDLPQDLRQKLMAQQKEAQQKMRKLKQMMVDDDDNL